MRAVSVLRAVLCAVLPVASVAVTHDAVLQPMSLVEQSVHSKAMPQNQPTLVTPIPDPLVVGSNPNGLSGYIPPGPPYDNPQDKLLTDSALVIPQSSDCSVRAQTVIEIGKVRKAAAQMAASVGVEAENIGKRKSYIEQMTVYLNDRIRELNKVKTELADELRWVAMTNKRIELLNKKEQQMKVQDILACMNVDKNRLEGSTYQQKTMLSNLQKQAEALNKEVTAAQTKISDIQDGKEGGGGSTGAGAPAFF